MNKEYCKNKMEGTITNVGIIHDQGFKGTQYGRRRGFKNCCSIVREQVFARPNILIEIPYGEV